MNWLYLAFVLQHADAQHEEAASQTVSATWISTGSLVRRSWHLGVRPAFELDPEGGVNWGVGFTIQVSAPVP